MTRVYKGAPWNHRFIYVLPSDRLKRREVYAKDPLMEKQDSQIKEMVLYVTLWVREVKRWQRKESSR